MSTKKKGNGLIRYTTYYFNDQDPIIGVLFTAKREKGLTDSQLAASTKLSPNTPRNWFNGKTKRPQFASVAAAAVALGFTELPITTESRRKLKEG